TVPRNVLAGGNIRVTLCLDIDVCLVPLFKRLKKVACLVPCSVPSLAFDPCIGQLTVNRQFIGQLLAGIDVNHITLDFAVRQNTAAVVAGISEPERSLVAAS